MDCRPPGSSVHEISQARIPEWVATSFSGGSSQPRVWTCVSCIGRQILSTGPPGESYWALERDDKPVLAEREEGFGRKHRRNQSITQKTGNRLAWLESRSILGSNDQRSRETKCSTNWKLWNKTLLKLIDLLLQVCFLRLPGVAEYEAVTREGFKTLLFFPHLLHWAVIFLNLPS